MITVDCGQKDKGFLSIYFDKKFIGSIESTTASFDIVNKLIEKIEYLEEENNKLNLRIIEVNRFLHDKNEQLKDLEEENKKL